MNETAKTISNIEQLKTNKSFDILKVDPSCRNKVKVFTHTITKEMIK